MTKFHLINPCTSYKRSFLSFVDELVNAKDPFFGQYAKYAAFDREKLENDFQNYKIQPLLDAQKGIGLPEGYVPASTLWLVDGHEILGRFGIRHNLTPCLMDFGGHIGYVVRPSVRGKGLAKLGLKLSLEYCRKELGLNKALLTCDARNEPSYRVIVQTMKECGGEVTTPVILKDCSLFNDNPYHPVNKNNLTLRFWLNT